jgi:hypothetical protein
MSSARDARPRRRPVYRAVLAVRPDGFVTDVELTPGTDAAATVAGLLDCLQPVRLRLTRELDMWVIDDSTHSLPFNLLAAGLGLRHGLCPRCYHGTVLICAAGPAPAGLGIDQVRALIAQIADIAEEL